MGIDKYSCNCNLLVPCDCNNPLAKGGGVTYYTDLGYTFLFLEYIKWCISEVK